MATSWQRTIVLQEQRLGGDDVAAGQRDRRLHDLRELAEVAGPLVREQPVRRLSIEADDRFVLRAAGAGDLAREQQRQIARAGRAAAGRSRSRR